MLREVGYARLLALVVVAGALTGGLVDYQFKLALQRQSTDPAALGQWLGLFNVAASGLALVTQLAAGVLLARFGSRLLAFVLPAGVDHRRVCRPGLAGDVAAGRGTALGDGVAPFGRPHVAGVLLPPAPGRSHVPR